MPFDSTTQINPNPDVKIFLDGLMLLVPAADATSKRCDVYVINHHASGHELSVEVGVDEPQPTFPFLKLGANILRSGLEISTAAPAGVKKYEPNGTSPPGVGPLSEAVDFSVINPGAQVEPNGTHPGVIKIRDGVLYAASRSGNASFRRGSECHDRPTVGTVLAASLDLNEGELRLTWGANSIDLPRQDDPPGTKYIISISNSRPIPPPPGTNDFPHLYNGIKGVAAADQFSLVFKRCGDLTKGTPRIPCMPGVVGG